MFSLKFENKVYACFVARDITERKKAEQALKESEKRYRRIVETSAEGIWVIDANNNTIFVNDKMAEMLGYSYEEIMGKSLFYFMDEENLSRVSYLTTRFKDKLKFNQEYNRLTFRCISV